MDDVVDSIRYGFMIQENLEFIKAMKELKKEGVNVIAVCINGEFMGV